LVALVAGFVLPSKPTGASSLVTGQVTPTTCDPGYGCPPPTNPPPINPSCSIVPPSAHGGTTVTATLSNVPVGTVATLLFDGDEVGRKTTTADGQGQTALGASTSGAGHLSVLASIQTATGGVVITFTVPASAAVGMHSLVFAGAGFSCDTTNGNGFEVLAADVTQPRGGGSLVRTGIHVALYLAIALALLLVGFQFVQASRRRRRRLASARHRAARPQSRSGH